jgi:hypothetical protein
MEAWNSLCDSPSLCVFAWNNWANSEQNVEECDATKSNRYTKAGYIIKLTLSRNSYLL